MRREWLSQEPDEAGFDKGKNPYKNLQEEKGWDFEKLPDGHGGRFSERGGVRAHPLCVWMLIRLWHSH